MKLHQQLFEIDEKTSKLAVERESLCAKIHEEATEAARLKALEYKTTIQNGDYGLFNGKPVFFVDHRGEIVLVGLDGTHPTINMNDQERESDFIKHGNIFEVLKEKVNNGN